MNDVSFEAELRATFITEASEMLEDTESALVALEANPDDAKTIDRIFRSVHTIKGSAHMAGFPTLGQFAHVFETLLGALREKKLAVTAGVIDVLLAGNDSLKDIINAYRADPNAPVDVRDIESRIKSVLSPNVSAAVQTEPRIESDAATAAPTILICDDEPEVLRILSELLNEGGYRVVAVDSSLKALEHFRNQPVDAIITDLKMPGMDGIEFVTAVRAVNAFIPIAFASGHSSREHFKEYINLGVDSFIEKPFVEDQVLGVTSQLIREGSLRRSMLALSKLSFQVYVSVEKLLSTGSLDAIHKSEKAHLDRCMAAMCQATKDLLASEKALKR